MNHTYESKSRKEKILNVTKEKGNIETPYFSGAYEKQHQCECCGKCSNNFLCNECNEYFYELEMIEEIERTLSEESMDNVDPFLENL